MSAVVIPFKETVEPLKDAKCSFCGTPKSKASAMVQSGKAAICDKCVKQAKARAESVDDAGSLK